MTERFFGDGQLTPDRFHRARVAARLELRPVKAFFRGVGEVEAIGTSGTINSTLRVARDIGAVDSDALSLNVVERLIDKVCESGSIDNISMRGLSVRRSQVWPGGLAILAELIGVLGIEALKVSDGALREGLLYDLLGRLQHSDARERTVESMAARYNVDQRQAKRVAATAAELLEQCREDWSIDSDLAAKMLDWGARLHEIGLDISHDGFQRHGAYVAENADMPGFPRAEQRFLAFLIGSQRHQIATNRLKELPRAWRTAALRLAILLRLAVLLNRSRRDLTAPEVTLKVGEKAIDLGFDTAWLDANPLSVADLDRECGHLDTVGYALTYG
jgi:exopolyphosphatase/guanosine-5'-triphosphate,3'-diphosphate pyrophosphatase